MVGRKGRQTAFIAPGSYRINTLLIRIELTDMTMIPDNAVDVVTTLKVSLWLKADRRKDH
jgi:hypothetical protein